MFTPNLYRPEHLFVVRLWCEPSQATPPGAWRGSVEHVPSGARIYFTALADLSDFIHWQIAPADAATLGEAPGRAHVLSGDHHES